MCVAYLAYLHGQHNLVPFHVPSSVTQPTVGNSVVGNIVPGCMRMLDKHEPVSKLASSIIYGFGFKSLL